MKPRIALLRVFPEENWPSMDLVATELGNALQRNHSDELDVRILHPEFRRNGLMGYTSAPGKAIALANRLANRAWDYPRWLTRQLRHFDLFHIMDHSYANLALVTPPERTVVTCHDLDAFRSVLEPHRDPRPQWFRSYTQRLLNGLRRARHVCFISRTVHEEALRSGIVRPDNSSVVFLGANPRFADGGSIAESARIEALLGKHASGKLMLHVGSTIPRKRIDILLRILKAVRAASPEVLLVRVGGALTEQQMKLAHELGVADAILTMPFLTTGELANLYRRCAVTIQCSQAEGFGLPVAEALTAGCPVVASDLAVLREVGGTATFFVDLEDIGAWKSKILKVFDLRAGGGINWEKHQMQMREVAVLFSWDRAACSTLAIYKSLFNNSI